MHATNFALQQSFGLVLSSKRWKDKLQGRLDQILFSSKIKLKYHKNLVFSLKSAISRYIYPKFRKWPKTRFFPVFQATFFENQFLSNFPHISTWFCDKIKKEKKNDSNAGPVALAEAISTTRFRPPYNKKIID